MAAVVMVVVVMMTVMRVERLLAVLAKAQPHCERQSGSAQASIAYKCLQGLAQLGGTGHLVIRRSQVPDVNFAVAHVAPHGAMEEMTNRDMRGVLALCHGMVLARVTLLLSTTADVQALGLQMPTRRAVNERHGQHPECVRIP